MSPSPLPLIDPAPGTQYPHLAMHGDPAAVDTTDVHIVGVAYGPATRHGRRYAAYTMRATEQPPRRYHADMHRDDADPSDPTSPTYGSL